MMITRKTAIERAIVATLTAYPFLLDLVTPAVERNEIKRRTNGWIITVWLCPTIYKRVRVRRDGSVKLLASDQPL